MRVLINTVVAEARAGRLHVALVPRGEELDGPPRGGADGHLVAVKVVGFAYGVRGVLEMRVSVRDGGVTSAAAVAQAMSLLIIIMSRAAMRFDAEAMRFRAV